MALPGVGHQPEGATGAQLGVCQLDAPPDPADKGVLRAPVKLERFALPELERNESSFGCGQSFLSLPQPGKCADPAVAAGVTQFTQRLPHLPLGSPLALAASAIGFEPQT